MKRFTRNKFLGLARASRHKHLAALLRSWCEEQETSTKLELLEYYRMLCHWCGEKTVLEMHATSQQVADAFHSHISAGAIPLKEHSLLPLLRHGDRAAPQRPWPIDVYLDNLRSAHNVGSIIRTAEGLALGTVFLGGKTADLTNKKVLDAAMGCHQWQPCRRCDDPSSLPRRPLIALETSDAAQSLYDSVFPDSFTLLLGNEEYGLSDTALRQADLLVTIPMRGRKNSLNVACAFACVVSEIQRQRTRLEQ